MPGKILGLDIREDSVTAVQVISGIKGHQVIACADCPVPKGGDLENALETLSREIELKSDTAIVSIPSHDISYRNIQMPFHDPKKIKQTLPFEMETVLPFPIEDVIIDFNIADQTDQNRILAASLKKTQIAQYLEKLKAYGIDPDIMDIQGVPMANWLLSREEIPESGIFIEIGDLRSVMILFQNKRIVLIRPFSSNGSHFTSNHVNGEGDPLDDRISSLRSLSQKIQNTVHSFGWQNHEPIYPEKIFFSEVGTMNLDTAEHLNRFLGISVERVNIRSDKRIRMNDHLSRFWDSAVMDRALALTLRDNRKGHGFNFRKGEFEVTKRYEGLKNELRKIGIILGLVLLFIVINLGVDYSLLKNQYEAADQRLFHLYQSEFPDEKNIRMPLDQLRIKLNQIEDSSVSIPGIDANQKVVNLLKDISERLPKSMDIRITNMVIDQTIVRMSGETDSFNTVDAMKNNLEPSSYFSEITISSAKLDRSGKRVQFELKLERKAK
ncbi:MAG: pilus assembly protein PilM [Deltaproteobacteria bacterium]|nr:pilus assembly protein PilM [Deltaproteobacteria bacterium]